MSAYVQKRLDAIVAGFVEQLENGTAPWIKPYAGDGALQLPKNRLTRRPYKGLNVLILWDAMLKNGWSEPYFLTYKQCQMMEGHVKSGSKGVTVIFWGPKERDEDQVDEETGEIKQTFIRKCYTVFNIGQCEGIQPIPKAHISQELGAADRNPFVNEFVERAGATVVTRKGATPAYVPSADYIIMPPESEFIRLPEYHAAVSHELVHWSGAKHRLDRMQVCKYGDRQYAYEELVAELGAAFLCAYLQVPLHQVQHAEYLGAWVSVLKEHPSVLWSAASKATQAFEYLKELAKYELPEDQEAISQ
ncbi:hypothetical protein DESUT3_01420 [Desulfuromonas versatilis]|uniref:DUF1738 domain-containing protein n=1 Tax=Desulfuromonas versatilis TaxID=2802975 RepID=A0ABM8HQH8_9BACT|nr:zincin-like metallopeptidase domain-containing protein [Desulfuromonas versatilis]BCR03073.1 hypothetical protein DESUT3_01420 [Desulfuromonas versatilis]